MQSVTGIPFQPNPNVTSLPPQQAFADVVSRMAEAAGTGELNTADLAAMLMQDNPSLSANNAGLIASQLIASYGDTDNGTINGTQLRAAAVDPKLAPLPTGNANGDPGGAGQWLSEDEYQARYFPEEGTPAAPGTGVTHTEAYVNYRFGAEATQAVHTSSDALVLATKARDTPAGQGISPDALLTLASSPDPAKALLAFSPEQQHLLIDASQLFASSQGWAIDDATAVKRFANATGWDLGLKQSAPHVDDKWIEVSDPANRQLTGKYSVARQLYAEKYGEQAAIDLEKTLPDPPAYIDVNNPVPSSNYDRTPQPDAYEKLTAVFDEAQKNYVPRYDSDGNLVEASPVARAAQFSQNWHFSYQGSDGLQVTRPPSTVNDALAVKQWEEGFPDEVRRWGQYSNPEAALPWYIRDLPGVDLLYFIDAQTKNAKNLSSWQIDQLQQRGRSTDLPRLHQYDTFIERGVSVGMTAVALADPLLGLFEGAALAGEALGAGGSGAAEVELVGSEVEAMQNSGRPLQEIAGDGAGPSAAPGDGATPSAAPGDGAAPSGAQGDGAAPSGAPGDGAGPSGAQGDSAGPSGAQGDGAGPSGAQGDGAGPSGAQGDEPWHDVKPRKRKGTGAAGQGARVPRPDDVVATATDGTGTTYALSYGRQAHILRAERIADFAEVGISEDQIIPTMMDTIASSSPIGWLPTEFSKVVPVYETDQGVRIAVCSGQGKIITAYPISPYRALSRTKPPFRNKQT